MSTNLLTITIPALSLSFPRPICHSRPSLVIPAPLLSFPRRRESSSFEFGAYSMGLLRRFTPRNDDNIVILRRLAEESY
jgi:hypothetical protein